MKKLLQLCLPLFCALCLLPCFTAPVAAAESAHLSMGMANYPLIIGCVVGSALVLFIASALILKHKRK